MGEHIFWIKILDLGLRCVAFSMANFYMSHTQASLCWLKAAIIISVSRLCFVLNSRVPRISSFLSSIVFYRDTLPWALFAPQHSSPMLLSHSDVSLRYSTVYDGVRSVHMLQMCMDHTFPSLTPLLRLLSRSSIPGNVMKTLNSRHLSCLFATMGTGLREARHAWE